MKYLCYDDLFDFSPQLIQQSRDMDKLLTMELELSHYCNYSCKYCYENAGDILENELSLNEIYELVDQAKDTGVRVIVLICGGEPTLYPDLKRLVMYIFSKQIAMILFTNGSMMSQQLAQFLFQYSVFPVLKANGIKPKTINWICGNDNAYNNLLQALDNLAKAGYVEDKQIGISAVICKQNYDEIPILWKWIRRNNMIPHIEPLKLQGRAESYDLNIDTDAYIVMIQKLYDIDKDMFGIKWKSSHPTIGASNCNRLFCHLYIQVNGNITPYSGVSIPIGNVRENSLQEVIVKTKAKQELRHIEL